MAAEAGSQCLMMTTVSVSHATQYVSCDDGMIDDYTGSWPRRKPVRTYLHMVWGTEHGSSAGFERYHVYLELAGQLRSCRQAQLRASLMVAVLAGWIPWHLHEASVGGSSER